MLNKSNKIKINTDNSLFSISLFTLFLILFIIKIIVIYISYKNLFPIKYCIAHFVTDYYCFLIIGFLLTINLYTKSKLIKYGFNIINLLLIIIYYIDIFTIYHFQTRESLFGLYNIFNGVDYQGFGFTNIILGRIFTFIIGYICIHYYMSKKNHKIIIKIFSPKNFLLYFLIGVLLYSLQPIMIKNSIPYVQNIFFINIEIFKKINKMPIIINKKYEDYIKYESGDNKDINIILVFYESLSAIDSSHLGGNNNTPYLDKIQKDGITFPNFFSNGIVSHQAHISVLLGIPPIKEDYNYNSNRLNNNGLANFLNKEGYNTTILSTTTLFFDQKYFLSGVGFKKIIGEQEFDNFKKYTCNSAPDGDLYNRILQEIQVQTGKYFIGLETISFHEPYDTPLGKTEKSALQYSDNELYKFYLGLQNIGFFNNGILIIVGDHRKRTPTEKGEFDIFGPTRKFKSVATIVGTGIKAGSINNNFIQHTDFYYSLKKLLGHGDIQLNIFYNDIFSPNVNRNRGIVDSAVLGAPTDNTSFLFLNGNHYDIDYNHSNEEAYNYYLFIKNLYLTKEILSENLGGL